VKAFYTICASKIDELADRTGEERPAILFAGDDASAKGTPVRLIADANFVPVDTGALADASIFEPSSIEDALPVLTEHEARRLVPDRATTAAGGNG
jgi:predicted dinucleotide-binding enzyme